MRRAFDTAARCAVLLLAVFTSLYCLSNYAPFIYTHVIQAHILPGLNLFVRAQPALFALVHLAAAASLWPRNPARRRAQENLPSILYVVTGALAALALFIHPVLPGLENNLRSLWWSECALLPTLGLNLLDLNSIRQRIPWARPPPGDEGAIFAAGAVTLLLTFTTYGVLFHIGAGSSLGLNAASESNALLGSFLLHTLFAGGLFACWSLARAVCGLAGPRAPFFEFALVSLGALVAIAAFLRSVEFAAMGIQGAAATWAALSQAAALVGALYVFGLRRAVSGGASVEGGLRLFFSSLAQPDAHLAVRLLWLALLPLGAAWLHVVASSLDVNGAKQKLCVALSWTLVFAAALALFRKPLRSGPLLFVALGCAGVFPFRAWRALQDPIDSAPVMEKLAAVEPAFGILHELGSLNIQADTGDALYAFMQENTNLPKERAIAPLDVRFASELGAHPAQGKPNIFIFVIDSLRRDYLSPYNNHVTFTPSIERFAKESDVFTNAFTHYGATGLAEPSIWVGGMMPHKQYITPFAPMNSLEKLTVAERYTRLISVDSILAQLLDPHAPLVPLDERTATGNYDLCATLAELRAKMTALRSPEARFFVYTQPQNLHISSIAREGKTVLGNGSYPGFYPPYASRLARIDACFGAFVDELKAQGLYDDSVIVLTADHGDLLGEEGLWGHAYNLNPEVIRIPLLIHRPARLSDQFVDTRALAFSTDLAPTLFHILGYSTATLGPGFGQSLYGTREPERDWQLLVSSYGPIYGILEEKGSRLFVADAVNYTQNYYEVEEGSAAPRDPPSADVRARDGQRIIDGIKQLHDAFHVAAPGGAGPD